MGGAFTRPLANPTPAETRQILNTILDMMFKRADLIDMYSLADPERCKKYVVVAESALKKLFARVQLGPARDPDGTFYFQKLEGIQKANPLGAQQDQYCKQLAFYFIRIFQIYGALTLSIYDGDLPQVDPADFVPTRPGEQRGVVVIQPEQLPGFQQTKRTGFGSWFGRGGELTRSGESTSFYLSPDVAQPYDILNKYLFRPSAGRGSMDDMRIQDYSMTMPQKELYDFPGDDPVNRRPKAGGMRPYISYSFKPNDFVDTYKTIFGRLVLTRNGDRMSVRLEEVELQDKPGQREVVEGQLFYRPPTTDRPRSDAGKELPNLLHELFMEAADRISPIAFSAVGFLYKHKYLRALTGAVPIEGTGSKISIVNPKAKALASNVDVVFRDRTKVEGESKEVTIRTSIKIEKATAIEGRDQKYRVVVSLEDMQTSPGSLKAALSLEKKTRYSDFSTGVGDTGVPANDKGQSIPAYLLHVFEGVLKGAEEGESRGGIVYKKGVPQPYNSPSIQPSFKVKALWESLRKDPPVKAHCVARAVQLLNVSAIRENFSGEAYSQVCRIKFPYVKDSSLPEPGKPITSEASIAALSLLFVDGIVGGVPKITETQKFKDFRKRMNFLFERYHTLEEAPEPASLSEVTERQKRFCMGHDGDRIRLKDSALVGNLRKQARALLARQAAHLKAVMALFEEMFDLRKVRAGVFEMNPTFLSGGMKAVNAMGERARDVLIDYYSDCETTYHEGLILLERKGIKDEDFLRVDARVAAPAAPAPVVASPPPAPPP